MMSPMSRRGDRRPQLHRLDPLAALGRVHRGQARHRRGRADPRRGSLRPAARSRSASSSTSPCRRWWRSSRGRSSASSGPPGVGKTSLAKSIARCTDRRFVRLSLGGVRDEAEIRGHRRTYIGALPGKIIQSLKKAGSGNPVFLLDEIDKMSHRLPRRPVVGAARGARPRAEPHLQRPLPRSRLRPLARCMFICTANTLHGIPLPLQDRMEIIQHRRLHRSREDGHRAPLPGAQGDARPTASRTSTLTFTQKAHPLDHPQLHQGSRRAEPRARDGLGLPQGGQGRLARTARTSKIRITSKKLGKLPGTAQASATGRPRPTIRSAW